MGASDVIFRRINIDPPGSASELSDEAAYIHNLGPDDVELTGWTLRDEMDHPGAGFFFIFPAFTLRSGGTVAVHTGAGADDARNLYWNRDHPVWNNDGDAAILLDAEGNRIAELSWDRRTRRVINTREIAEELADAGFGEPTEKVRWTFGPDGGEIFWQKFGDQLTVFHQGFPDSIPPDGQLPEERMIPVRESILRKYIDFGGPAVLGRPLTLRRDVPTNRPGVQARRQDFEGGVIFRSPQTSAHVVRGPILQKYLSSGIGGAAGPMGMPFSDELEDPNSPGLLHSEFEGGSIWYSPGQRARAIFALEVQFRGLHCFGDTGGLGSDEIYFSVAVAPGERRLERANNMDGIWGTKLPVDESGAYIEMDPGTTSSDLQPVYIGRATPLNVNVNMWENDRGDPNALRENIAIAVRGVGAVTAAFIPEASAVSTNPDVQATVVAIINAAADTDDDFIARGQFSLTRQEILERLNKLPAFDREVGLEYHDFVYLTDGDATYKAYFSVKDYGPVAYAQL